MNALSDQTLEIIVLAAFALIAAARFLRRALINRLQTRHGTAWEELRDSDEQRILRKSNDEKLSEYFRNGRHRQLGDATLNWMVPLSRALSFVGVAGVLAMFSVLVFLFEMRVH